MWYLFDPDSPPCWPRKLPNRLHPKRAAVSLYQVWDCLHKFGVGAEVGSREWCETFRGEAPRAAKGTAGRAWERFKAKLAEHEVPHETRDVVRRGLGGGQLHRVTVVVFSAETARWLVLALPALDLGGPELAGCEEVTCAA